MKPAFAIVLICIASCARVSFCYPSKPLNERSTELVWEAWLLVDQTNGKHDDVGMLRRRITPKSVFITPTFSPESLPACADGYTSDTMGRCVKIVKINESAHFNFILQKLNAQFPDYVDTSEDDSTQGPLQFNIPLVGDDKSEDDDSDVAIVVTPSRTKHLDNSSVKVEVRRNGSDKFDVEDVAAILGLKPEEVEVTTIAELTTTMSTIRYEDTTTSMPTTTEEVTETTLPPTTTTEDVKTTTIVDGDALFFRLRT
jgi:hypothetical protein